MNKSKKYINEYKYTIDTFIAMLKINFNQYSYKINVLLCIIHIYTISMYLLNHQTIYIIYTLLIIFFFISVQIIKYLILRRAKIKAQTQKFGFTIQFLIEKNFLTINNTTKIPLTELKRISKDSHWLVLTFKNNVTYLLKKDCFISSTANECYQYLKEYLTQNKSLITNRKRL